jgi:hypothetical protein
MSGKNRPLQDGTILVEERGFFAPYYVAIASPLLPDHLKQSLSQDTYTKRIVDLNRVLYGFKRELYVQFFILASIFAALLIIIWWFTADLIFGCRTGSEAYNVCVTSAFPTKLNVTIGMSCTLTVLLMISYIWLIHQFKLKFLCIIDETVTNFSRRDRDVTWSLSPVIAPYGIYDRELLASLNTKNAVKKFRVAEVKSFEIHIMPRPVGSVAIPSAPILPRLSENESAPDSAQMPPAYV